MLMPMSRVRLHVAAFRAKRCVEDRLEAESIEGHLLIQRAGGLFKVSSEAARCVCASSAICCPIIFSSTKRLTGASFFRKWIVHLQKFRVSQLFQRGSE